MNTGFPYRAGELHCEDAPLADIARDVGTPVYVYSQATLRGRFEHLRQAFGALDPLVCYSVKANGNLAVLQLFKELGAGFDVVSGGELYRTMKIGADPQKVVFAGVGKTDEELRYALRKRIFLFNVESEAELRRLHDLARATGQRARVAVRVNPDVDPQTHRYISTGKRETKFGVDFERARGVIREAAGLEGIELLGLHMHIGSQLTCADPYKEALARLLAFVADLEANGLEIQVLNLGGGFGIDYEGTGAALPASAFADAIVPALEGRRYRLVLEPGRFIAGPSGVLLARVVYIKRAGDGRRFVILDAGMNDLIRPALYGSYHRIWPVRAAVGPSEEGAAALTAGEADIVGPICESGDFLAKDRPFPEVEAGDLVAVFDAGAYGFVMASQYNAHPRPAEVLVSGDSFRVARRRETYEDLVALEV